MARVATFAQERLLQVLAIVAEQYLRRGRPVSSAGVIASDALAVGAATVRAQMAELQLRGLLFSPHTSSGRIPTARGFGVYVRELMRKRRLSPRSLKAVAASLRGLSTGELAESAAESMARRAQALAFVSLPAAAREKVRRIELVHIARGRASAIVVGETGDIRTSLIGLPAGVAAADLGRAARYFNANFSGCTLPEAGDLIAGRLPDLHERIALLLRAMLANVVDRSLPGDEVKVSGAPRLLHNPCLNLDRGNLRELVDLLEQKELILNLIERGLAADEMSVSFGPECGVRGLRECAVVTAPYAAGGGGTAGAIGIIGPLRMPYGQVLPLVGGTARLLAAAAARVRGLVG